jgi:hypothetical protein
MPSDPSAEVHKDKKKSEDKKKAAIAAKAKKGGGEEEKEKKERKKQGRYTPTVLCYSDDGSCIAGRNSSSKAAVKPQYADVC